MLQAGPKKRKKKKKKRERKEKASAILSAIYISKYIYSGEGASVNAVLFLLSLYLIKSILHVHYENIHHL